MPPTGTKSIPGKVGLGDVVRDTRKVNGQPLSADVNITAASLGALTGSTFQLPVAWARINGKTGGVVSSVGVSSVTRNGTGQYTVTFTKPMLNSAYAVIGSAGSLPAPDASWVARIFTAVVRQASAFSIITVDNNVDQYVDADVIDFCVFGEVP